MKRVGAVQIWPALRNLAAAPRRPTSAASVSSQTITGEWPPSSMMAGFIAAAQSWPRCLPTEMGPVKVIARMIGEAIRWVEISEGSPKTRLTAPAGTPASCRHSTSACAAAGVSSEAFRMIEQPAPSAPPSLRAGDEIGKFHGAKAATGPIGWRSAIRQKPGSPGMSWP